MTDSEEDTRRSMSRLEVIVFCSLTAMIVTLAATVSFQKRHISNIVGHKEQALRIAREQADAVCHRYEYSDAALAVTDGGRAHPGLALEAPRDSAGEGRSGTVRFVPSYTVTEARLENGARRKNIVVTVAWEESALGGSQRMTAEATASLSAP